MRRLFKILIWLAVLVGIAVVVNAVFFELEPNTQEVTVPVDPVGE